MLHWQAIVSASLLTAEFAPRVSLPPTITACSFSASAGASPLTTSAALTFSTHASAHSLLPACSPVSACAAFPPWEPTAPA